MNILYLTPTGSLGGAEICLLDVIASLRKARPDWTLSLLSGEDGPLVAEAAALGVRSRAIPLPPALARLGDAGLRDRDGRPRGRAALAVAAAPAFAPAAAYIARLRKAIRLARPDCIHTNGMKAHVLGAAASPRGVSIVWHLHDYLKSRAVMARLLRLASRRGVRGVAVSNSVAADARESLGDRVPVETIYNAVDLDRFRPDHGPRLDLDRLCGRPPAPSGTVQVGLVGTFARWKGQDVFLEAIAKLDPALPARFTIVGGPIYKTTGSQWTIEELRAKAESLGIGDRVGFTGYQPDPAAAIRALDVLVHASTRPEPFGRVIVEGMACGKAVVAVSGGGSAELFEDGITAIGTPCDDPVALSSALTRLIGDRDLRQRLGVSGRKAVETRFDRDGLGERWAGVYVANLPHEADKTAYK